LAALDVALTGTLSDDQAVEGRWKVALDGGPSVKGTLAAQSVPALPQAWQSLLEDGLQCDTEVARVDSGAWKITAFEARMAAGKLSASGVLDPTSKRIEGTLKGALIDAAKLAPLLPVSMEGAATIDAKVEGSGEGIQAVLDISAEQVVVDQTRLASAAFRFKLESGWLDDPLAKLRIDGGGDALGLQPGTFEPQDVHLALDVAREAGEPLQIRQAVVTSPWGEMGARGAVELEGRMGDISATVDVPTLGPILALGGLTGVGAVHGDLCLQSRAPWPTAEGEAHLVASELAGLPAGMAELFGGEATFDASGAWAGDKMTLNQFDLRSTNVSVTGQGGFEPESRRVRADVRGAVADVSALTELVGQPLGGSATFGGELQGTLDALAATVHLYAEGPRVAEASLEHLVLTADVTGLPVAPAGKLQLSGTRGDGEIAVLATLASLDERVELKELAVNAGPNQIHGAGNFHIAATTGTADLTLDMPDLAYVGRLMDMPLDGTATGEVHVAVQDGLGSITGNLSGEKITTPYGAVAEATLNADLRGPENLFVSALHVDVRDASLGESRIQQLAMAAQGNLADGIAVRGDVAGLLTGGIALEVALGGTLSENATRFGLDCLEGKLGAFPFALESPATVAWHAGEAMVALDGLTIGEGRFFADGNYGPGAIDMTARWENMPLALAELVRDMPVAGWSDGEAHVTGTAALPRVHLVAKAREVRALGMADDTPALDTELEAALADGTLAARARAEVPEALTLTADASMPASWSIQPFAFDLPTEQAIQGSVQLDSDLGATVKPFQLEQHQLAGTANANLALGGTLAAPTLNGRVTVSEGAYTNTVTGTALKDMEVFVTASGRRAVIERLSAAAPSAGGLEGGGEVAFPAGGPIAYAIDTKLHDFRMADRDDFTGMLNGEVRVEGTAEDASVTGTLELGPAAIRMPGQLPPSQLRPVDIEMAGAAPETEEDAQPGFASRVKLDLYVSSPGHVVITGPVLKTEWRSKLHVVGTAADPRIDGSLGVVRGNLDFLGRRFDLAESTITFDKSRPPDPFLDIKATSVANDITALLNLNGTMDNLEITLNSDPSFPEDEVLARVLFGKSLADITPVQALQLVRVADMLRAGGSGRSVFAGDVRSPRLDHFEVKPGGASGETAVVVGQYVTDKIYVEVEQGSGRGASKGQVEAQISPQFSVRGTVDSTGGNGAGIFWKRNY